MITNQQARVRCVADWKSCIMPITLEVDEHEPRPARYYRLVEQLVGRLRETGSASGNCTADRQSGKEWPARTTARSPKSRMERFRSRRFIFRLASSESKIRLIQQHAGNVLTSSRGRRCPFPTFYSARGITCIGATTRRVRLAAYGKEISGLRFVYVRGFSR